jgi:phosphopantetheine adenylyltransferase
MSAINTLIVSAETWKGAGIVNGERQRKGMPLLTVISIPLLKGSDSACADYSFRSYICFSVFLYYR